MSTPNTHYGYGKICKIMKTCRSVHFIGVGGIMMSSLAILTARRGYLVTGSDRVETELTRKVAKEGINVIYGHFPENTAKCDAVVYTVAIPADNPEYLTALSRGIPLISRADYLGYMMMEYGVRVGVAGMHGKSTCTSMCAKIMMDAGVDPTVISGAETDFMDGAYRIGGKNDFLFEACEYEDSFLDFNPTVAVLLNAEMEHIDYFKSIEQIRDSFAKYASLTGDHGFAVANADDENIMTATQNYKGTLITFGIHTEAPTFKAVNITVTDGCPEFDILKNRELFAHIRLSVCGKHNVYNALAAMAVADICGIDPQTAAEALMSFRGAKRRMEYKGKINGAVVYDDYGHHPTEVKATLDGAKMLGFERLICVFQSHTYSRTAELFDKFVTAFDSADKVIFADIYAAREQNIYGVTPEKLAKAIGEKASYGGKLEEIAAYLKSDLKKGDLLIIMGAGDIYKLFGLIGL